MQNEYLDFIKSKRFRQVAFGKDVEPEQVHQITQQETPRDNFTMVPNIVRELGLDPYEFRLYVEFRKVAGDTGACWKSTRTLAQDCNMSAGKVSSAKRVLEDKGLIKIEVRHDDQKAYHHIRVIDIWQQNHVHYMNRQEASRSPHERSRSPDEQARSPHELKNISLIKSHEKDPQDTSPSNGNGNGHTAELTRLYEETTGRTISGAAFQEIEDYWRDLPDMDTWRYAFRQAADKRAPWAYAKAILESKIKEQERREAQMPKPAEAYEDIDAFMGGLT